MIFPLIMSSTGDMYKNWLRWKQFFSEYMLQKNYYKLPEGYKINFLKRVLGGDALKDQSVFLILNNSLDSQRFPTLSGVLHRLDSYFSSMKNELVERYHFFNRFQGKDEPFEKYICDLNEKAKTCNFGNLSDSIIRDKVIANIHSKELRSKLFETLNLDLAKLLQICNEHEANNKFNNEQIVGKRQTQTNALHSSNIVIVEASNSNNKKVAEGKQNSNNKVIVEPSNSNNKKVAAGKQNSNNKVNANINVKTSKDSKNDKTKTDPENDNSGNNIIGTINQRHSDISNKAKADSKIDNSGNNIIGTTTNRRHSITSYKAKTDSKTDNSDSNIMSTACRENNTNIGDQTKINSKNGNNISNHIDLVCGENTNDINDKAKIDSKVMNSNHNMNMARRNSESSGTQYRRNCWRCNEKHAQRCCPAWGHKCENCGERNHFLNCCKMIPLKTKEQHINMSSKENVLNPNPFQHNQHNQHNQDNQQNQPKPIPPNNYNQQNQPKPIPPNNYNQHNQHNQHNQQNQPKPIPPNNYNQHNQTNQYNQYIYNQYNQPKPIPPNNYNLVANIEPCHIPSAPEFFDMENELYPKLQHIATFQEREPLSPVATIGNTEPKTAAIETKNHRKPSKSEKADTCSIS